MTLTPTRPVPAATSAAQQRLEVELLLGEVVVSSEELNDAGAERWQWHPSFNATQCKALGCLPIAQNNGMLVVAVPSHWGTERRQSLIQLAESANTVLQLRLALPSDLDAALLNAESEPIAPTPISAPAAEPIRAPAEPEAPPPQQPQSGSGSGQWHQQQTA